MTERKDKDLQSVYEMLNRDHSPLREQLLEQLPQRAPRQSGAPGRQTRPRNIGEIIMKSNWTRLTAAAVVIIAVGFGALLMFDGAAVPAYAIEQTVQANRAVRSIHLRVASPGKGLAEAWATFGEDGEPLQIRMDFPESEDGHKVTVWEEGKASVWVKSKNVLLVVGEPNLLARIKGRMELFDPRMAMKRCYKAEAAGEVTVNTVTTDDETQSIEVIVTTSSEAKLRTVFLIDPVTKLVTQLDKYEFKDGEYSLISSIEYLDYNGPIDPEVWQLDVPDDAIVVDQTIREVGLTQGDSSKEEVVVEVVRQFFQALADKDYAMAGKMLQGLPAAEIENSFGKMKVLRVVSMGEPKPLDKKFGGSGGAYSVPCTIEIEVEGRPVIQEMSPWVRQVHNKPQQWTIFGHL